MPKTALALLVIHFEIAQSGGAARAPIHHIVAAIDELLFPQAHEGLAHGAGKARVHREALASPIAGRADALHLLDDAPATLLFPLPDALFELRPTQLTPRDLLLGQ